MPYGNKSLFQKTPTMINTVCRLIGAVVPTFCLYAFLIFPAYAQYNEDTDPVVKAWGKLANMNQCAGCHYRGAEDIALAPRAGEFSRRNEAQEWVRRDKHAIARRRVEPLTRQEMLDELSSLRKAGRASPAVGRRLCVQDAA